jgi:opacity protein-like surface antigen
VGATHQTNSGASISSSDTSFAIAVGGGIDYKLVRSVSLRAQFDSIHDSLFSHTHTNLRISTGIVFKF